MFVLGIDPGVSRCGYGVLDASCEPYRTISAGVLTTPVSDPLPQRLACLSDDLSSLFAEFTPSVAVIERVFFQTNVRTAMSVGQASGLALVAATQAGAEVVQYTANEVKLSVAGDGSAKKHQVQEMVQRILRLPTMPDPPDVADALALALCHLAQASWHERVSASLAQTASVGAP